MEKLRYFRRTTISTNCDACNGPVDMIEGGVCTSCRRILCYTHLYGSWVRRLASELGAATRCVECRRGGER